MSEGATDIGALIAAKAWQNNHSEKWRYSVAIDNFPKNSNKCNKFVADICNSIGHGMIVPYTHTTHSGHQYPPTAGDWGTASVYIPGWTVVNDPRPGDVVGQLIDYPDATGHCAIVVKGPPSGRTVGTQSLEDDTINYTDWGFRPGQAGKVVFRRYNGTPNY